MLNLNAIVKNNEENNTDVIADVTITVKTLNYEKCFERLYPMILKNLSASSQGGFPHLFSKLNELQDTTSDAVVRFLSSFTDSTKEELIKAAFDDIVNDELIEKLNAELDKNNVSLKISNINLCNGENAI